MPRWVVEGYLDYAQRLPPYCALCLVEIAAGRRGKKLDIGRAIADEGQRMLRAIPTGSRVVALEVNGQAWSTEDLAVELQQQFIKGQDLTFLIGGPDGLAAACLQQAAVSWSLSRLTFPHMLVRIMVAEQLYRAWSMLQGHPYHRAE